MSLVESCAVDSLLFNYSDPDPSLLLEPLRLMPVNLFYPDYAEVVCRKIHILNRPEYNSFRSSPDSPKTDRPLPRIVPGYQDRAFHVSLQDSVQQGFYLASPSTTSAVASSDGGRSSPRVDRPSTVESRGHSPEVQSQNWEDYARQIRNPDGTTAYQCLWTTSDISCTYSSKKQLVKRHIETTHLKFKYENNSSLH